MQTASRHGNALRAVPLNHNKLEPLAYSQHLLCPAGCRLHPIWPLWQPPTRWSVHRQHPGTAAPRPSLRHCVTHCRVSATPSLACLGGSQALGPPCAQWSTSGLAAGLLLQGPCMQSSSSAWPQVSSPACTHHVWHGCWSSPKSMSSDMVAGQQRRSCRLCSSVATRTGPVWAWSKWC